MGNILHLVLARPILPSPKTSEDSSVDAVRASSDASCMLRVEFGWISESSYRSV